MPGLGAIQSPPDERDYKIDDYYASVGLTAPILPPRFLCAGMPDVLDQGDSPECVAYSSAAMKMWQDQKDQHRWFNFDENRFFSAIGGTNGGAMPARAMYYMYKYGYPTVGQQDTALHKIAAYYLVPSVIDAIKRAIFQLGPVVIAVPWYHSWMDTGTGGVLKRPDYQVGGHAIIVFGWNEIAGYPLNCLILRNSWGRNWGMQGSCYLPYPYVNAVWEVWKTVDVLEP